jgi:hypothetical protein
VDAAEETVEVAVDSAVEEVVVTAEDEEEGFQEVVDEVSLTSPRSSDSQGIDDLGRGIPFLRIRAKFHDQE